MDISQVAKSRYRERISGANAVIETTLGTIEIELFIRQCPEACWNFINLAEGRQITKKNGPFFDGMIFHRVLRDTMIMSGCPNGDGMGGPGYRFAAEFDASLKHDEEGILSMANDGSPQSQGSQFCLWLEPAPHLDGRHCVFGKVIKCIDVVRNISHQPLNFADCPTPDIAIKSVRIIRKRTLLGRVLNYLILSENTDT
nr:peptidylprolyl isomerase [uncultured Desulfuromonas sp.]